MTKKIYITRHGQTDYNKRGVVQGSGIDADLNETGLAQADAFYQAFKDHPFDKLYVSGLKRTYQSMAQFIEDGLAYEKVPELNEISWGIREGIPVDEEGNRYYFNMIDGWKKGDTHLSIEGGESPNDVAQRMRIGIDKIMANTEEKEVLICMHGRSMRILLTILLNYPLHAMDVFEHKNLCLYELEFTGSMFKINRYNQTSHLNGLAH